MKIFVVSDTHFNHANIIKYCKRPFYNTHDMNEKIIEKWNEVVNEDDVVYHLGDFGFGSLEELSDICNRLNGKKYLVMGNHDYRYGKNFFKNVGFIEVDKKEIIIDNVILTHYPKVVDKGYLNIYGHIHDKPVEKEYDDKKHYCVSLERTSYYPIELDKVLDKLK